MNFEQRLTEQALTDHHGLYDYLFLLQVGLDELEGKRVLDLGGCLSNNFVREAMERYGTDITPINLNPALGFQSIIDSKEIPIDRQVNSVAGDGAMMPFRDGSFDFVFSTHCFPKFFDIEQVPQVANEIWRILDKSGQSLSWPYSLIERDGIKLGADPRYVSFITIPDETMAILKPSLANCTSVLRIAKPVLEELPDNILWLK